MSWLLSPVSGRFWLPQTLLGSQSPSYRPRLTILVSSWGLIFPAVIIPVVRQHYTMLARNLLYTGVTRGKRLVVLVGQKKAVGIAVRGGQMNRRWTKLREWLASHQG